MTTFVLIHGTGHGGWCWQEVAPLLREAGARVHTPTLTGVSDRSHVGGADVTLSTHITDVANLLFYEDVRDVVLVGHSYAGMVITGVAATAPERLGHLVYLDAYLPDPGQTEVDLWPPDMRAEIESNPDGGGDFRAPPTPELMGITDPGLAEWVMARVTPHPMRTYTEPAPAPPPEAEALKRTFISCTEGPLVRVFKPFADKARDAGWPVREIATGHEVALTRPRELAEVLLDVT